MDTISQPARAAAAAVTGARHLRTGRNGQDAAIAWAAGACAVVVVCDGCGSSPSSEVGARLGASLVLRAISRRLLRGESPTCVATWDAARGDVVRILARLLDELPGEPAAAIHEHFLFTIVAAAANRDGTAVWAIGDGAYAIDHRMQVLGPFADNQPPYLAYDLIGDPQAAHFEVAPASSSSIVVATDGGDGLALGALADARFVSHPDALRRHLTVLARAAERIDWDAQRIVRGAATLQDDCAIGVLLR